MANPVQIILSDPKFEDLALSGINSKLGDRLSWLSTYGAAILKETDKGFEPQTETTSNNTKNYLSLFPDSKLGTYSFWAVRDGAEIKAQGGIVIYNFTAGLIVWGDLRDVYPATWETKNVNNVLFDVVAGLQARSFGTADIRIGEAYFGLKNIYKEYTIEEVEKDQLHRPFFGFRIDCEISHKQTCP